VLASRSPDLFSVNVSPAPAGQNADDSISADEASIVTPSRMTVSSEPDRPLSMECSADPQPFFARALLAPGDLRLDGLTASELLDRGRPARPDVEEPVLLSRLERTKCNAADTIRYPVTARYC
jgi:hypothetical protein